MDCPNLISISAIEALCGCYSGLKLWILLQLTRYTMGCILIVLDQTGENHD